MGHVCPSYDLIEFIIFSLSTYNYKVEEDEVGGTCGTNGGEEERV
jgi:hypothetical protein